MILILNIYSIRAPKNDWLRGKRKVTRDWLKGKQSMVDSQRFRQSNRSFVTQLIATNPAKY